MSFRAMRSYKTSLLLSAALSLFAPLTANAFNAQTFFDKKLIQEHIQTLASAEFQGRAPLKTGEMKTLEYLKKQYSKLGIEPLPGIKSFLLPVPLASIKTGVEGVVRFGDHELKVGEDIAIKSPDTSTSILIKNADVIFVGYGINDSKRGWNDYKGIDVKGKVVVTWVNDPGFKDPRLFRGKDMTYFGRWIYKFEEARRQGARGAFVIHEDDAAGYGWSVASSSGSLYIVDEPPSRGENPPLQVQGWIKESAIRALFSNSKLDYDDVKRGSLEPGKAVAQLSHSALSLKVSNLVQRGTSNNLCGIIQGKNPDKGAVLVSAHWDHLGLKTSSDGAQQVYAGAIDNASGVAAMLELGRYFHQNRILTRSLILCSFTAEEQGLLGAKYFVTHSPYPVSKIVGMLNLDSLNTGEINPQIVLSGGEEGGLGSLLSRVAEKRKRKLIADPFGEKGYFFRSDHYPFVLAGIKALNFLDIGFSNPDYLKHHYHQTSDVYHPDWSLNGFIEDLELFKDLIVELGS